MGIEVAHSQGIKIFAPKESRLSFFNSPYHAHFNHQAVDIYPPSGLAASPVAGKIKYIREFNAPAQKQFHSSPKEYLIAVETQASSEYLVRILHVKPSVRVGEEVEVGAPLGKLIRSGYFDFWTDPHMHVEIRPSRDLLRAKGGVQIFCVKPEGKFGGDSPASNFKGKIFSSKPEYVLLDGPNASIGQFTGVPVFVGGKIGVMDGGVPHYGFGGVISPQKIEVGDQVSLGSVKIGRVVETFDDGWARFEAKKFFTSLENFSMRGISSYLGLNNSFKWKLIPNAIGMMNLQNEVRVILST